METTYALRNEKIIQGLMRLKDVSVDELYDIIIYDIKHGIHFFDISNIYGDGESERKLGEVLKKHPELRNEMIIQSKCGIMRNKDHSTYYDLSYENIVKSCEDSLKRMNIEYLDYFLFHRPDIFADAEELARAMSYLKLNNKVLHFGVSNFPHEMIKHMYDNTNIPIEINQLQLGLGHLDLVREVFNCNMNNEDGAERTGELFFYMKRYNVTLQCWSPYQFGFFEGSIFDERKLPELNKKLSELATKYKTNKCAIATAFLLKLGNNIQVVTGSMNKKHIQESLDGIKINLTKQEWYALYTSTGCKLP